MDLPKAVIYTDKSFVFYYTVLFWGDRAQIEKEEHWHNIGTTDVLHKYRKMGSKSQNEKKQQETEDPSLLCFYIEP